MDKMLVLILLLTTVVLSLGCMPKKDVVDIQSGDSTPLITSYIDYVMVPTISEVDIVPVTTYATLIVDTVFPAVQMMPVPAVQVPPIAVKAVQVAPVMVPAVQIPSVMVPTVQITPVVVPGVKDFPEKVAPEVGHVLVNNAVAQSVNVAVSSEVEEPVTTESVQSSTVLLPQIDAEPIVVHATNLIGEVGHNFDDDYKEDYDHPSHVNHNPHVIINVS